MRKEAEARDSVARLSSHPFDEGKALAALLPEGATLAPAIAMAMRRALA